MEFIAGIVAFIRDLVIIILGIVWIITGILVGVVAWLSWRFAKSLPERSQVVLTPARSLLGQAQQVVETAGDGARTAREAVVFISERAVMPTILVLSAVAGVRQFMETLFAGRGRDEPEAPS